MRELYAKWPKGAVKLLVGADRAVVSGRNFRLELEPRAIYFRGPWDDVEEASFPRRKNLYITVSEALEGDSAPPRIDVANGDEVVLRSFEVRLNLLEGVDSFLTLITPGTFLYDYAILTSRKFMAEMSSRRRVYASKANDMVEIYIV